MSKVLVLGAFGYTNNQLDGQTIKTRNVYNLLRERYDGSVKKTDTIELRSKPLLAFVCLWHLITCKTLVLIPCLNNMTYIFPVTYIMSKIFGYEIISICIGGWQLEYYVGNERFKAHPRQLRYSKAIKAFLPEMVKVDNDLKEQLGFRNTEVFPNFRPFTSLRDIVKNEGDLRLVYMARINKKKGYPAVFRVLEDLKTKHIPVTMSFYGQIADEDKEDFLSLIEQHSDVANYGGSLKPQDIQGTLMQYDVLLLPTQYYTEGFPGSILDAYIAGIPVIVTEWKHSHEFVRDGETGYIVPFENGEEMMTEKIVAFSNDRELLYRLKENARMECEKYSVDSAWNVISKYL